LDLDRDVMNEIDVDTVLKYRSYIQKLPILIKLIDFCDHSKIRICYETLDMSSQAKETLAEEALALLDGQFGDIKVRIHAVKKLSMLTDSQIALFMPQLIQALKYELFHQSPLSEFLLEKALQNTRVVGHALFWQLRANLEHKLSRERFFLMLERFLMCCGQYKNELYKQTLLDKALVDLSNFVDHKLEVEKLSLNLTLELMHQELRKAELRIKLLQQLVIAHARYDDKCGAQGTFTRANQQSEVSFFPRAQSSPSLYEPERSNYTSKTYTKYTFEIDKITEYIDSQVSNFVQANFDTAGLTQLSFCSKPVYWTRELLVTPFAPKYPLSHFERQGMNIFLSKKKPLLICAVIAN
jgi:hypothetical protein